MMTGFTRKKGLRLLAGAAAGMLLLAGCGSKKPLPVAGLGETTGRLSGLTPVEELPGAYVSGYEAFTARLFKTLYQTNGDNPDGVFFSPASLYMALGMTAEGMEGDTLQQTMELLHMENRELLRGGNRDLQSLLTGNPKGYFSLSNAIWIRDEAEASIKPTFLGVNKEYYGALVSVQPFNDTLIPAINGWVEQNTDGMIREMLKAPLDPDAFMFLVNTVLFDGKWKEAFEAAYDSTFHGADGDTALPLMSKMLHTGWYEDEQVSACLLDYQDDRTAMLVALPKKDMDSLVDGMTEKSLSKWLRGMTTQTVDVTIPRFSMDYRKELKDICRSLGMTDAFEGGADFSSMTDPDMLPYIGSILHQTALEVSEEGTKAAAATSVEMRCEGAVMDLKQLKADRPFLCAIVDKPTGAVLFLGAVMNPQELE